MQILVQHQAHIILAASNGSDMVVAAAAPPPPAAAPRAPAKAPLREYFNQPLITNFQAAGVQYKHKAVQQNLDNYFNIG